MQANAPYRLSLTSRGFSLLEVTVAMVIMGMVTVSLIQFNFVLSRSAFDSRETVEVANKIRTFTSNLSRDGRQARKILMFRGMPSASADLASNRRLADNQTGDLVIFIHTRPERIQDATAGTPQRFFLEKIIAYARVPDNPDDPDSLGPVLRYEITRNVHFSAEVGNEDELSLRDDASQTMLRTFLTEMLVPGTALVRLSSPATVTEVVELSRGLANGNLFRNFRDNSVVVNGEIVAGNFVRRDGQLIVEGNRFVNNTYNFTITRQG